MSCVAPPLLAAIAAKYTPHLKAHEAVRPLIHDVFGAIHRPSLRLLHAANLHMRGRSQVPSSDDALDADVHADAGSDDDAPAGVLPHSPLVSSALRDISVTLQIAVADHVLRAAAAAPALPASA